MLFYYSVFIYLFNPPYMLGKQFNLLRKTERSICHLQISGNNTLTNHTCAAFKTYELCCSLRIITNCAHLNSCFILALINSVDFAVNISSFCIYLRPRDKVCSAESLYS